MLKELIEKKNDLISEAKGLLDACKGETEVRSFDESEKSKYDELTAEIEKINKSIQDEQSKLLEDTTEVVVKVDEIEEKKEERGYEMKREEFFGKLEKGAELAGVEIEERDYNAGTGGTGYNSTNKGADSIPLTIEGRILKAIDFHNPILGLCNTIRTSGTHRLVIDATPAGEARMVREGAAIGTLDSEFRKVELTAYKVGEISKWTAEVAQDTNFNLPAHVSDRLGLSISKAIEKYLIEGSGNNEPQGLLAYNTGAGVNDAKEVVTASKGAISADDIYKAYYNLPHEVRNGSVFLCHPSVVQALAMLKDTTGRQLIMQDLSGEFFTIMGKRIIESPYMKAMGTAGSHVGMFVNLNRALTVGLRKDISVRQLHELYAANDLIAIVGLARFDSKIVHHGAISAIKTGA